MTKTCESLPMTHRIALLVYDGFELLDAAGPASVFAEANRLIVSRGESPFYGIEIISSTGGPVASNSGVVLLTRAVGDVPESDVDTLLVVGAHEAGLVLALTEQAIRDWVPRCAAQATRFGSVCSGTFILAALGLLDGKRVATHWDGSALLAEMYPAIEVDRDRLYVVDGRVWTSAGVATGIDMALAIVERDVGASVAALVARRLVVYARRPGHQSQFSPVLRAQVAADAPFRELIDWIHENLHLRLDVPVLAERAGLSERNFYRKFASATGKSPARFIEAARLDAARTLLSQKLPLKVVASHVGFATPARLSIAFERCFGLSPRLFREFHARADG